MAQPHLESSKRPQRRARILLAEDDDELRHLVASLLAYDGYEVIEVSNGQELLDYLVEVLRDKRMTPPDLILTDVCMPEASGLDVLQRLKSARVSTPVVLMTAFPDPLVTAQASSLGATTLITKPFELDDLRMIVLNLTSSNAPEDGERQAS
jgi:DNA-binding response OmpR family regulator